MFHCIIVDYAINLINFKIVTLLLTRYLGLDKLVFVNLSFTGI